MEIDKGQLSRERGRTRNMHKSHAGARDAKQQRVPTPNVNAAFHCFSFTFAFGHGKDGGGRHQLAWAGAPAYEVHNLSLFVLKVQILGHAVLKPAGFFVLNV